MIRECSAVSRLLIVGVSVVAISYAGPWSRIGWTANYDYVAPQVAPPSANQLSMAQLADIFNETAPNPPYLVAYQLTTTDADGTLAGAAPLKVVPTDDPVHPYLGVFHNQINTTQFATYLGYSTDLRVWNTLGEIHRPASQPDMRISSRRQHSVRGRIQAFEPALCAGSLLWQWRSYRAPSPDRKPWP